MRLCKIPNLLFVIWATAFFCASVLAEGEGLIVYSDIPGGEASDQYQLSVRQVGGDEKWRKAFALITKSKQAKKGENNYFSHLNGWSNTYINFEMTDPVEVEITRVDGKPIRKAKAHPKRKASVCVIKDGKAYVTISTPCQIAVDIDGQMDDQNTGKGYVGVPIHTVTIFANPVLKGRPSPDGDGVLAIAPGEIPPSDGKWKTLYFLPGLHDIGVGFPVHANKNYYIPGDAVVFGTMHNYGKWDDGHDIRIYGYGTLSGAKVKHPKFTSPPPEKESLHNPIDIVGAANTLVEGITIADSAHHSLMLISGYQEGQPTNVKWTKIFTWRANGDGINPFGNALIEDCFIRTQDDCLYASGRGIRRVTCWNDVNGSTFVLSALPNKKLIVEDCDVIYARASWHHWSGGRIFNMRGEGKGESGKGVVFRNIRVSDPKPTLQHFMIAMQGFKPYADPVERLRGAGDFAGVLFQNIKITAPSILEEPDVLWGAPEARIRNLTFDNVSIAGKKVDSLDHFKHNEYVTDIKFK